VPRLSPTSLTLLLLACGGGGVINEPIDSGKSGGEEEEGVPNIVVGQTVVDFGELPIGGTATASMVIENSGTGTLEVTSLLVDSTAFLASAGAGLQIAPASTTTINLTYSASDYEPDNGTLTLESTDPDQPSVQIQLLGSVITDGDGDGDPSEEAGGTDCDDEDAEIFPGATDEWYDGVDANCDGADDYDQDADGFQTDVYNDDATEGGGDCMDGNAAIYPGAPDTWYDGVDSDCAGGDDFDQDGDGELTELGGRGFDCDDADAEIYPEATETFNALDDNCDGLADNDVVVSAVDVLIEGTATTQRSGYRLTMGDLNSDDVPELVIGSPGYSSNKGAAFVFDGSELAAGSGTVTDADLTLSPSTSSDQAGTEVQILSAFSTSGDPALAIGATAYSGNQGAVYVVAGDDAVSGGSLSAAMLIVTGTSGYTALGRGISPGVDLDGDGLMELWGTYSSSSSPAGFPYYFLHYGDVGTTSTTLSVSSVDARFYNSGSGAGASGMTSFVPAGADLDGDGYQDQLISEPLLDQGYADSGSLYVLWGRSSQYIYSGNTTISSVGTQIAYGDSSNDREGFLSSTVPDHDGDGDDEIWTYCKGCGTVSVLEGGAGLRSSSGTTSSLAVATYTWDSTTGDVTMIRSIGDWSGDSVDEVAIASQSSSGYGTLRLYEGGVGSGALDADEDAWVVLEGDYDADATSPERLNGDYGAAVASTPQDMNGDGKMDLLVGDPGWGDTTSSNQAGAAFLLFQP
jgi:Putative metal-binding motif/FG-GAP repeat